ncbi:MAG: glycosyltransferase [Gammaproteobacteria bacterium]|nr:glycosyltransferase [Gammaproteobacteria bacterium]
MSQLEKNNLSKPLIRIKFLSKLNDTTWLRQLPDQKPVWNNCEFIFDKTARDYDWLVVYEDLPKQASERFPLSKELLACPQENTIFLTMEPSTIKSYGKHYTAQYGHVITSQEEWALPHPHRITLPPNLPWFYGLGSKNLITYDMMKAITQPVKTQTLSTVCSVKKQKNTLHYSRYQFTWNLKKLIPELEIYGRGVRDMDDKSEALDDYKYHITIENYIGKHHYTEKLSDAFLGFCLPFYHGCPNAADYFPPESFIPVNIHDIETTRKIISDAIKSNEYEKRLPYIMEARRRVLDEYNIFAVICREVNKRHTAPATAGKPITLYSRRALRKKYPLIAISDIIGKFRAKLIHKIKS